MGLPFLNNRAAGWLVAAPTLGKDFSPRWIMDGMIRLGPFGDRFLPLCDGSSSRAWPPGRTACVSARCAPECSRRSSVRPTRRFTLAPRGGGRASRASSSRRDSRRDPTFPLRLIGRRDNRSNNSWLHNVPKLMRGERCRRLRVHPDDANRLGLRDGGPAVVRSRVGALDVEVRVTDEVMPGVVSLPHGWGHTYATNRRVASSDPGPNCNDLIDARVIEPLSGMAFLNGFPVAVEPAAGSPR